MPLMCMSHETEIVSQAEHKILVGGRALLSHRNHLLSLNFRQLFDDKEFCPRWINFVRCMKGEYAALPLENAADIRDIIKIV